MIYCAIMEYVEICIPPLKSNITNRIKANFSVVIYFLCLVLHHAVCETLRHPGFKVLVNKVLVSLRFFELFFRSAPWSSGCASGRRVLRVHLKPSRGSRAKLKNRYVGHFVRIDSRSIKNPLINRDKYWEPKPP